MGEWERNILYFQKVRKEIHEATQRDAGTTGREPLWPNLKQYEQ